MIVTMPYRGLRNEASLLRTDRIAVGATARGMLLTPGSASGSGTHSILSIPPMGVYEGASRLAIAR